MIKFSFIIILCFLPGILFAQVGRGIPDTYKVCDKVFVQVETLPDFKKGKIAFEDTLAGYLKQINAFPKTGNITYVFIVTKGSQVLDIKKTEGSVKYEKQIKDAFISIPDLWTPAIQNTFPVCAYVGLSIEFSKSKLTATVVEPVSVQPTFWSAKRLDVEINIDTAAVEKLLLNEDKDVLVIFDGWANCEKQLLSIDNLKDQLIRARLEKFKIIKLYVDERAKAQPGDRLTIGKKNLLFQKNHFGSVTQPYHIIFRKGTPVCSSGFLPNQEAVIEFLKKSDDK